MSSGNVKPPISESPLSPLERLQLLVPGFRGGYKIKDLIRQDDFLVRKTAASMLEEAQKLIERIEEEIARNNPLRPINTAVRDSTQRPKELDSRGLGGLTNR
ncbi:hypothetical protein [Vulcanisaeta souniana]|uniref:hypothetical protein n=1 Tax=Vulcanisaeta souniana TaxID=164452 RepID=UPI000AF386C2|nr:hypothetical protein [Vulcanisaeta souniana]